MDRHAGGRVRGRGESAPDRVLELEAEDTPRAGDASNTEEGTIRFSRALEAIFPPMAGRASCSAWTADRATLASLPTEKDERRPELHQGGLGASCALGYSM